MLTVQVQIRGRDMIRVRHIVINSFTGEPMFAGPVFLCPTNCGINRHIGDVNTLRHQLTRHALGKSGLRMAGHRWLQSDDDRAHDRAVGQIPHHRR